MDNVVRCRYLIVEFIVTCHKSKFTEKYKGCQIKVLINQTKSPIFKPIHKNLLNL